MLLRTLFALLLALAVTARQGHALPTDLDPAFGTGGVVTTPLPGVPTRDVPAQSQCIHRQSDGKLLVAGTTETNSNVEFPDQPLRAVVVVRYLADGSLDASYGVAGKVFLSLDHSTTLLSVAVQNDNKVVLAVRTWPKYQNFLLG